MPTTRGNIAKFLDEPMDQMDKNHFKVAYARNLISMGKKATDKYSSKINWNALQLHLMDMDQKWMAVVPAELHTGHMLIHRANSMLAKWRKKSEDVAKVMAQEREKMQGTED